VGLLFMAILYYAILFVGTGLEAFYVMSTLSFSLKPWAKLVFALQLCQYEKDMGASKIKMYGIRALLHVCVALSIVAPVWFILVASSVIPSYIFLASFSTYFTFLSGAVLLTSLLISARFVYYIVNLNVSVKKMLCSANLHQSATSKETGANFRRYVLLNGIVCVLSTAVSISCMTYYGALSQANIANGDDVAQENKAYSSLQDFDLFLAIVSPVLPSILMLLYEKYRIKDTTPTPTTDESHAPVKDANTNVASRARILTKVNRREVYPDLESSELLN